MKRHIKVTALLSMFILLFLYSCARKLPDIYWPLPPEQPRIKFVKSIASMRGFFGMSAADVLLGARPEMSSFVKPLGIHVDKFDRLYITDTGRGTVMIFDIQKKKGKNLTTYGRSLFLKPIGVASDAEGNVYVSDSQKNRVFVYDKNFNYKTSYGENNEFKQPTGLAMDDKRKKLYVVDTHRHHVLVLNKDTGQTIMTIGKRGTAEGEFNYPSYIKLDTEGKVYVVDTMNGRVQVFDPQGRFIKSWGQLGDAAGMFARPKGIAIDSEGHIYVVDAAFNNVQIFNDEGETLMAFGEYGEGRGEQILPAGIAIDSQDRIYVVDQWNARINVYEFMGEKYLAREGGKK